MKALRIVGILVVAFLLLGVPCLYVVDQTQTGILLQFGKPKTWPLTPGLLRSTR